MSAASSWLSKTPDPQKQKEASGETERSFGSRKCTYKDLRFQFEKYRCLRIVTQLLIGLGENRYVELTDLPLIELISLHNSYYHLPAVVSGFTLHCMSFTRLNRDCEEYLGKGVPCTFTA